MTNAILTAFCACLTCCGPRAVGITASGVRPVAGVTVAAHRTIPFGTIVTIHSHRYVVQDRMSTKYGTNQFDVYFRTHREAVRFGRKTNQTVAVGR